MQEQTVSVFHLTSPYTVSVLGHVRAAQITYWVFGLHRAAELNTCQYAYRPGCEAGDIMRLGRTRTSLYASCVVAIFPGGELWEQQLMWEESGSLTERSDYIIMQCQNARRNDEQPAKQGAVLLQDEWRQGRGTERDKVRK